MLYEYQKSSSSISLDAIAGLMSECAPLNIDHAQSLQTLRNMIDEGSRFANLERVLGQGSVLLLCHNGADAMGTKLLPKEGRKFNEVVEVLRRAGVHDLAKDYVQLRNCIVSWYHDHVLEVALQHDFTPAEGTPLPSSAYTDMERVSQLHGQQFQDPCLSAGFPPSPLEFYSDM
ncbi:hypothetical protein B0A48_18828 [Cryoendolithus antarcticus]|uniref:Uncharacterized protein n=1 Tax=Cryoendolithus antarcticus TaxID=1507870 RepID=A0A1V8S7I0_9PEZI|nr:hypothetical protein B0A48_18828 [Cryoendolithus antarcticus]